MSTNLQDRINEHFKILVPKLARHLRNNDFDRFEYELRAPNLFCLSNSFYLELKFWLKNNDKDKTVSEQFFVKTAILSEIVQRVARIDRQFHNEFVFYRRYAKDADCYPKCVYIDEKLPYDSTLVLEDVNSRGYTVHPKKIDVPLEDILVAMKEIARFHAKTYVMKEENPQELAEILDDIKECRYERIEDDENPSDHFFHLAQMTTRAVDYLKKIHYDRKFCEKAEKLFEDTYNNVIMKAIVPSEPLATICHGDFTVNNVLFKREDSGETRAMLIDFAMLRYASPAIDLSTFLCLSCSHEDRSVNFPKILRTYHEELIDCLQKAGIKNLERFSFQALWDDYVQHGLIGFVVAAFFIHVLMGKLTMNLEEMLKLDMKENVQIHMHAGGDEVSSILADMLLEMEKMGCLDAFL